MISQNTNALGIVFPNSYDSTVPQLVSERLMASIPFAGRYRMIDFTLSSMSNCGINNVSVIVRKNYYSLMDHLGAGREWDLTRRRGGLNILPPFSEKNVKLYNGRVEALLALIPYLERQKEKYAILTDSNLAMNYDYNKLVAEHQRTGADVTLAYHRVEVPRGLRVDNYYTIECDGEGKVQDILMNDDTAGAQNLCMNIYVIEREKLIRLVKDASVRGMVYFERDILASNTKKMDIRAVEYTGYVARICDMKSYFDENLKLINEANLDALFPRTSPVFTKIRDDNPTRYMPGSHVESSLIADGCRIEGRVENCVLFRGVTVEKGATVRNCVLMQDTIVEANVNLECVVADKNVTFTTGKQLFGTDSFPIFVRKHHIV